MSRSKISVIGAGFVGSTTAHLLATKSLGDVVLIDINGSIAKGKALDIYQSIAIDDESIQLQGGSDYQLTKDSDVVVICAGFPRKEGMSRDDLLKMNGQVITEVCQNIKITSPNAFVIVVSNPLDAMTYQAAKVLQFPKNQVMGMAGILDTARFRGFLAEELQTSVQNIQTLVLGGHGDTMVPVLSQTFVGHRLLTNVLSSEKIDSLVKRTQQGGGELVRLLQKGSAYYAPARGVVEMIESILKDQKKILPCTVFLNGEYGYHQIYIGVPCQLGQSGAEKVIEVSLTEQEQLDFKKSVNAIHINQKQIEKIL